MASSVGASAKSGRLATHTSAILDAFDALDKLATQVQQLQRFRTAECMATVLR
jgi:hypothetical protein